MKGKILINQASGISSCNCCSNPNYEMRYQNINMKKIYEIKIINHLSQGIQISLCGDCIKKLVTTLGDFAVTLVKKKYREIGNKFIVDMKS